MLLISYQMKLTSFRTIIKFLRRTCLRDIIGQHLVYSTVDWPKRKNTGFQRARCQNKSTKHELRHSPISFPLTCQYPERHARGARRLQRIDFATKRKIPEGDNEKSRKRENNKGGMVRSCTDIYRVEVNTWKICKKEGDKGSKHEEDTMEVKSKK